MNEPVSQPMNQNLQIAGQASLRNAQIGGIAGRDLTVTQIQGQVVNVTIRDPLDLSGMLGQVAVTTHQPLTQQDYRQRQVLLNKVKQFWITGVLARSLYTQVFLELELKPEDDAVNRPFSQYQDIGNSRPSVAQPGITEIFNQMGEGRTLLILGEPGSGKTTTLLKLAQNLIARAEEDLSRPIPVVFNLSSWAQKQLALADWLIDELHHSYKVSPCLAQGWVEQQQLLLLLDGLDEVGAGERSDCVQAINQFMDSYGTTEIVICCRQQDYAALPLRLSLQGAICIQALPPQHVQHYLEQVGQPLDGLRAWLARDTALQAFARSPLNLSVMALAYQGLSATELLKLDTSANRLSQLWRVYVARMLQRRSTTQHYSATQIHKGLQILAQQLSRTSQTVFLIEQLQPNWCSPEQYRLYRWGVLLIGSSLFGLLGMSFWGGVGGGIGLITSGCILARSTAMIKTVETIKWSTMAAMQQLLPSIWVGLPLGLALGTVLGISGVLKDGILGGVGLGLVYGLCGGLVFSLIAGLKGPAIATKTTPNQGIFKSLQTALLIGGAGSIIGAGLGLLVSPNWLTLGLMYGLTVGFLSGGGQACLQHFMLRILLYANGTIPWNYARFLDEAAERILLQKTGGGYMFVHRQLLDYFAQQHGR
jgi:energy-coupling factor transporter ATP-binding protein EcfA2